MNIYLVRVEVVNRKQCTEACHAVAVCNWGVLLQSFNVNTDSCDGHCGWANCNSCVLWRL